MATTNDYSICNADISDAEVAHSILWDAWKEIPLNENFQDEKYKSWVAEQCQNGHVWIVKYGTQIVGVEIFKDGVISYLAIHIGHRRNGLAKGLVRHAKSTLNAKLNSIWAKTKKENQPMIKLLELENFRIDKDKCDIGEEDFIYFSWYKAN